MEGKQKLQRVLLATGLTAGLVATGTYVTGASPVRALTQLTAASPRTAVLPGALHRTQRLLLDGTPTDVEVCRHPGRQPDAVLEHYARVAKDETPARFPYLVNRIPGEGGTVVWVTEGGLRKAALVEPDPSGGTRFRLLSSVGPPLVPGGQQIAPPPAIETLPGGLAPPAGFRVGFCVTQPDGTGVAVLEAPGSCRDVAARLVQALAERGLVADEARLEVFRSASPQTRVSLPLRHPSGSLSGHLGVVPTGTGARANLTVRSTS